MCSLVLTTNLADIKHDLFANFRSIKLILLLDKSLVKVGLEL
jgi:hypothetical protein